MQLYVRSRHITSEINYVLKIINMLTSYFRNCFNTYQDNLNILISKVIKASTKPQFKFGHEMCICMTLYVKNSHFSTLQYK